jgi:ribosomal protein S18 acetylase RimI-like enzyme
MEDAQGISVREAGPQDADAIYELILALAKVTGDEGRVMSSPGDFLKFGFGENSLFDILIAEKGHKAVGLCLYFFSFSTWLGEPGVYVQDLYVAEEERGTGLGRRLLCETVKRGHDRQATHLRLTVDQDNNVARHFYAHVGMHHRDDEKTYHVGGEEFLAMTEGRK